MVAVNTTHDEAAQVLRALIADPQADASDRLWAASDLAKLGPQYRQEAAQVLGTVLGPWSKL